MNTATSTENRLPPPQVESILDSFWPKASSARLRVDGKFFQRGEQKLRLQGVTYGPFSPNKDDEPFPSLDRVRDDFALMQSIDINAIRVYHRPPEWLLDLADQAGIGIFVDIPWAKHLCFLDHPTAQRDAHRSIREMAEHGAGHASILAYSIGNEIPPSVVRWHGSRRVERFLAELADAARQADPDGLVTYANYPSTEYLDLSFLDFVTFNVYLHEKETFRRYLFRLQNLVGDKPLVLGELGMDTIRHGELEQGAFLSGHLRQAALMGLAGAFVFSWTDDWHTGGHTIRDWAFGITDVQRTPKAAFHELREVFTTPLTESLPETPPVSVVVCSYNGGRTLDQCLRSLLALDYPDYEIIVVDDGSTDDTRAILSRFASVRAIHQANEGLSAARNAGLHAATGSIIAYTDSDCYADPHWLTHLVYQFQQSSADAVGGPNLSPEDGWLAACVAASPGQPMHVLVSDQEAEHIPGCNMAFRRNVLLEIKGFDPLFRKAGDDVDICWRLQHSGHWITFAPGAFVWHHRRQTPRAYFKQQGGYGEAEALLRFKHPDRFNGRGDGKWNGVLYGASSQGLRTSDSFIYRGVFGTGLFQCIYKPGPSHWATLPSTLEWHVAAGLIALATLLWPFAWVVAAVMPIISFSIAVIQSWQAPLPVKHDGFKSRLLVAFLCYAQPLVRSWHRYRTRFFSYRMPIAVPNAAAQKHLRLPWWGNRTVAYWSENGVNRLQLLGCVVLYLNEQRWGKTIDSGWDEWDLEIYCHPWTVVQVSTAQEDHGDNKHLIRIRYRLRTSSYLSVLAGTGIVFGGVGGVMSLWSLGMVAVACLAGCLGLWWLGTRRAAHAVAIVDRWAVHFGLISLSGDIASTQRIEPAPRRNRLARLVESLNRRLHRGNSRSEPPTLIPQESVAKSSLPEIRL